MASAEKAVCDYITLNKVRDIGKKENVREFLEFDLRIDPEHWHLLNAGTLRNLNKHYRNQTVERICEAL
jgi:hypothetical protein